MGGKSAKATAAALGLVLAATAVMRTRPAARAGVEKEIGAARWIAREIVRPVDEAESAVLGRPLALALDGGRLLVADAEDCAIKAFALDGTFQGAFGRKGRGPGELTFPSGLAVAGAKVFVADKLNSRIQVFDRDGRPAGGFPVPFLPDKVLALTADALLVTANPPGTRKGETLLHLFDAAGHLRWRGLEGRSSGDPVYDAFRNMILVCPGESGDFFVVRRCDEREVLRYGATGELRARIEVDGRHVARSLDLPFKSGKKRLAGFCWAAAAEGDLLYLAAPEPVDGHDLGPGRELSVIDGRGRLRAVVVLPRPVHRFVVNGDRILAIDDEGELAVFEFGRGEGRRLCAGLDEAVPPGAGPALLVFFSTECSVCYDDLFEARYLVDKGRWPVAVVGVSAGPLDDLENFLEKHAWTQPVIHDRRRALFRRFRVDAPPYKVLLVEGAAAYRDDPRLPLEDRRKELARCLTRLFSR
jgi:hypothetical protein